MCPHVHATLSRGLQRCYRGVGISRMEATRDIRRRDKCQQLRIMRAAFSQVAIEIDFQGRIPPCIGAFF